MYKIYCHVLNERLTKWVEANHVVLDNQNGFRSQRSTIDQIMSLVNIIDIRKKIRLPTFCAFIDFKKAYGYINRSILWERLQMAGVGGRMLSAIQSLYTNVISCVRINGMFTDWFTQCTGLPTVHCHQSSLFINELAFKIQAIGKGIDVANEKVSILLYADDVVLLAEK